MVRIDRVVLRHAEFPLATPYVVSARTAYVFDPIFIEVGDSSGRAGWGEALISPGYTSETAAGSWAVASKLASSIIGRDSAQAREIALAILPGSPGTVSALLSALDMIDADPLLSVPEETRVPLLAPFQEGDPRRYDQHAQSLLERGFQTIKVKVGFDWQQDLKRVEAIQRAFDGRASFRLDANRAFSRSDGISFGSRLDPAGIMLFEQPCGANAWEDNAAVAAESAVPVMLDESIYGVDDIDRAATIQGVGFVKLKLKKIGGLKMLRDAIERVRELGMTPVLGDGTATEVGCWMEACVAATCIDNAGEMNGFLKTSKPVLRETLPFEQGAIVLRPGWRPDVDHAHLDAHTREKEVYGRTAKGRTS